MSNACEGLCFLSKHLTHLPVDIWVDDSEHYTQTKYFAKTKSKSGKCVVFNVDLGYFWIRDRKKVICMNLEGFIIPNISETTVLNKQAKKVRNFILNNFEALALLADRLIDFTSFKNLMITGGKRSTFLEKLFYLRKLETSLDWTYVEDIRRTEGIRKLLKLPVESV